MTHKETMVYVENKGTKLILPECSDEIYKTFEKMLYNHQPLLIEENGMVRQFCFEKISYTKELKLLKINVLPSGDSVISKF